jgi:hypothetical protein
MTETLLDSVADPSGLCFGVLSRSGTESRWVEPKVLRARYATRCGVGILALNPSGPHSPSKMYLEFFWRY